MCQGFSHFSVDFLHHFVLAKLSHQQHNVVLTDLIAGAFLAYSVTDAEGVEGFDPHKAKC